jgi:hypothetical protein
MLGVVLFVLEGFVNLGRFFGTAERRFTVFG